MILVLESLEATRGLEAISKVSLAEDWWVRDDEPGLGFRV